MDVTPHRTDSAAQAWARALGNTARLPQQPWLTVPGLIATLADKYEGACALRDDAAQLSYRGLNTLCVRYARWALGQGMGAGDVVALLMPNCAAYPAIWAGISQTGAAVALINTNLTGQALLHVITAAGACALIVAPLLAHMVDDMRGDLPAGFAVWVHGASRPGCRRLDPDAFPGTAPASGAFAPVRSDATALLIFTSGTTGLPKAARLSHYRVLEWSFWFAGMMDTRPEDRLYHCLPMYHSTGGVAGLGAMLVNGGTVVVRPRFSARRFWDDVVAQECSLFLYIGELCRYLADSPPHPRERAHRLRLCAGNGMGADVWQRFTARFQPGRILEFYASTEGNVSLYNCEGKPGAIGRIPKFLAHRFGVALIACDTESGAALRDPEGRCIPCGPDEAGEAIGRISENGPSGFDGYTDEAATARKILRGVFADGDLWYRTGDLMRRDAAGFFYFVDRMGDSFRWKGENVSATEVAAILGACPGVTGAVVFGVQVPGHEGRAGMAAMTVGENFSLAGLCAHVAACLPSYARPVFVRLCAALDTTGTFKISKTALMREGFGPNAAGDPVYALDGAAFTPYCPHPPSA